MTFEICRTLLALNNGTNKLFWNVRNQQHSTSCNIPDEWWPHLKFPLQFIYFPFIHLQVITGGKHYLVRRSKIIFWIVGTHMFPNGRGQKHLVSNTKGQWHSKEDSYMAESQKESYVKKDRQITEERDK